MNIGLCYYQVGDGPLAERIGATYATMQCDVSEGLPDHDALIADMTAHGCRPIPDMRTSIAKLGEMIAGEGNPVERRDRALRWFSDQIIAYLDEHPEVEDVEVWASAELAQFIHGRGEMLDYASVLTDVYGQVKELRPGVRVWTGGFGCGHGATADVTLLERALAEFAPRAFDVCNMHPFLLSTGQVDVDCVTVNVRLKQARKTLDTRCAGQPLAATGFGIPTVNLPPVPENYGRFWKPFGVRAIPETEALDWYRPLLAVLEDVGLETVCLLARDTEPPQRFIHLCGLTRADGSDKAFTAELADWLTR